MIILNDNYLKSRYNNFFLTLSPKLDTKVFNQDEKSYLDYNDSFSELFDLPLQHQISLRINYFLDYNRFKKK